MLEFKETNHPYYCEKYSTNNYQEYDSWEHFKKNYVVETIDNDLNFLFRYDLQLNDEGIYTLELFYMQQRRGRFVPVIVANITKDDLEEINKYLNSCWDYMKVVWEEFSK